MQRGLVLMVGTPVTDFVNKVKGAVDGLQGYEAGLVTHVCDKEGEVW